MFCILFGVVTSQAHSITKTPHTVLNICALCYLYNIYQSWVFGVFLSSVHTIKCLKHSNIMGFVMWQESPGYGLEKDKKRRVYSWISVRISPSSAFKYNSDLCLLTSPRNCAKQLSMDHKWNSAGGKKQKKKKMGNWAKSTNETTDKGNGSNQISIT